MTKKQIKSSIKQEIKDYIFIIKKHQEMIHFYEGMIKAAADRLVKLENKEPAGFARDIEPIEEENIPF